MLHALNHMQVPIKNHSIGIFSHKREEFLDTFEAARNAGFTNINIDIMSALPGQTVLSYQNTLTSVLALHPEHISAYSLIIEEGTPFFDEYGETV